MTAMKQIWYDSSVWERHEVVGYFRSVLVWSDAGRVLVTAPERITAKWLAALPETATEVDVVQEYTIHGHRRWVMGFCSGTVEVLTKYRRNAKGGWFKAYRRRRGGPA